MTSLAELRERFPQYEGVSDGDFLVGLNRKMYPEIHPRQFLESVDGATNAAATIKNEKIWDWYKENVSKPLPGESEGDTATRLGGTSYGPVNEGGRVGAGIRSGLQGMTYGYGDEIVGKGAAMLSGNSPEFEIEKEKRRLEMGEEKYPGQSLAAELTGSLALPGATVRSAPAAIGAGTAGGMLYASGKADEGERMEDAKGAFAPSLLFSTVAVPAQRVVSKGFERLVKGARQRPSIGALKRVRDEAYKVVDNSGFKIPADQFDDAIRSITRNVYGKRSGYVQGQTKVEGALKLLNKNRGDLTITQADNLRKMLWRTWKAAKPDEEVTILKIIKGLDDAVDNIPGAPESLKAAREAHKVYMRADALDKMFQKAVDATEASGSGGNIYNNYKRVFKNILNTDSKKALFTEEQLAFMRAAMESTAGENTMRKLGKLSPDGNGLMLAMNIIGGTLEPSLFAVGGAGAAAKAVSDRGMANKVDDVMGMVAGVPPRAPATTNTTIPQAAAIGAQRYDDYTRGR